GIAQPADSDRMAALEKELMSRTGGPVKIMKATESSVVFLKPGKGVFRLGYYFDGEQYMFGKPEKLGIGKNQQDENGLIQSRARRTANQCHPFDRRERSTT
ncbi:MAG: hypothetical protein ACK55I_49855, partial [bacterium]